jgi:hypothetical protein
MNEAFIKKLGWGLSMITIVSGFLSFEGSMQAVMKVKVPCFLLGCRLLIPRIFLVWWVIVFILKVSGK